jgi:hypothetical protein
VDPVSDELPIWCGEPSRRRAPEMSRKAYQAEWFHHGRDGTKQRHHTLAGLGYDGSRGDPTAFGARLAG